MHSFVYQCFFLILIYTKSIHNYPTGAPTSVCASMTPGHGVSSQACSTNYKIQSDKTQYSTSDTVRIIVNGSTSSDKFQGILLIAKTATSGQIIGSWSLVSSTIQTIACDGTANTGVTHTSADDKSSIEAIWSPPSTISTEDIIIKATIVKTFSVIYVNCFSLTLTNRQNTQSTNTTTTTKAVTNNSRIPSSSTTIATTTTTTPVTSTGNVGVDVSWKYTNGVTAVTMKIDNLQTSQWLALGLSLDQSMGDDHVFVCKRLADDTVIAERRINPGGHASPVLASTISNPGGTFNVTSQKLQDGSTYCEFTLSNFVSSKRQQRAISSLSQPTSYYPLIAYGNLDSSNGMIQHTFRTALSQNVQLNQQQTIIYNVDSTAPSSSTTIATITTTSSVGVDVSWKYNNGVTAVIMKIDNLQTSQWLAIGLSLDQSMGEDHVFVCKRLANNTVIAERLINPGGHASPVLASTIISNPGGTFNITLQKLQDSSTYCEFTLSNFVSSKRRRRAISSLSQSTSYYPLIAYGNLDSSNGLIQHTFSTPLSQNVQLNQQESIVYNVDSSNSGRPSLMKAHGIIMIFSWILFASTGILISRYFKPSWPDKKLGGKAIWFAIHRPLMISVVVLTIIAFILILVYENGTWVSQTEQGVFAHSIIGIIIISFAVIQPIMALFRCKPDAENRFIFNYAHRFVGTISLILSIVAIFLAMFFTQFKFEANKQWEIMVAWTCWIFIIYFVFWFIELYFQKYESNEDNVESFDLGNAPSKGSPVQKKSQIKQDRIKLTLLIIHILVALGIALALAILVGIA